MKLIPIWAQAVIVGVIVAFIFGMGWKVASWKFSGKIATAEAERDAAVLERDEKAAFAKSCRDDMATFVKTLTTMREDLEERTRQYNEQLARPPRVVVRYRDRWHDAPDVIVSEDCPTAVGQLFEYLHTLPAYGGAG